MTAKPNCYECVHRGEVPGSAHSSCRHPKVAFIRENPMAELLGILGGGPPIRMGILGVTAVPHGISHGWFCWPVNFDPTWLLTCDGFQPRVQPKPDHAAASAGTDRPAPDDDRSRKR